MTGWLNLSPRIMILSLTFGAFLLLLGGAVPSRGRMRVIVFYLLMLSFPLVLLAAIEATAIAFHLAAPLPLRDLSILVNRNGWPAHFMSDKRKVEKDGLHLYRPWSGDGIVINELGLRTALPTPKRSGEWRIAITGGSLAFGWRMRDADTIPVQMQKMLHEEGLLNVAVYNFGIDAAVIRDELGVLKQFRKIYEIDEVIFLTGINDVWSTYPMGPTGVVGEFELMKLVWLLRVSSVRLQRLNELLPNVARHNQLLNGLIAADEYCHLTALLCDFVLQPALTTRRPPIGPEIRLANALRQHLPGLDKLFTTIYGTAASGGLPVHDFSDVFDQSDKPYFFDWAHLNEAGNRRLAARILDIVIPRFPPAVIGAGSLSNHERVWSAVVR
jgi:lysophospholipase L1-like esterase